MREIFALAGANRNMVKEHLHKLIGEIPLNFWLMSQNLNNLCLMQTISDCIHKQMVKSDTQDMALTKLALHYDI